MRETTIKPALRWVGGKQNLIRQIAPHLPDPMPPEYYEPFAGGLSLGLYIMQTYKMRDFSFSDANRDLMMCYQDIKDAPDFLIDELQELQDAYWNLHSKQERTQFYKDRKDEFNESSSSSLFIFLNKTNYNGLYRVNKSGGFNAPVGDSAKPKKDGTWKNPVICDRENILGLSRLFNEKHAYFKTDDFSYLFYLSCQSMKSRSQLFYQSRIRLNGKKFIYFDPPYKPIASNSFTKYSKEDFDDADQIRLAQLARQLSESGCKVMVSNSYIPEFFEPLYKGFRLEVIDRRDNVNCKSDRKKIPEYLIMNY